MSDEGVHHIQRSVPREQLQRAVDGAFGPSLPRLEWIEVLADDRPLEGHYVQVAHILVTGDYVSSLAVWEDGRFTTWMSRRSIPNVTHWLKVTPR